MQYSCLFILVFFVESSRSVPLQSSGLRIRRSEETPDTNSTIGLNVSCRQDDVEYQVGDELPSISPCEECVCGQDGEALCSKVKCQPNSGCKIIQQSGQCCPEYKCDCEYNERLYNNGERLDKPEDPCQVCYCKGGEIMCTSITCYERDDCQPHFSPGQCCPKYDHCPVEASKVSSNSVRSVNASLYSPKREMQPWPLTKPADTPSSAGYDEVVSNSPPPSAPQAAVYPQTIKIVEILPTTPSSRPSEVSVVPRVKINEEEEQEKEEYTGSSVASEDIISVTEMFEAPTSSSTSEIDHLQETSPHSEELFNSEIFPEKVVSTLNPLAESIIMTTNPVGESDSIRLVTVSSEIVSTTEGAIDESYNSSTEVTTEGEGSGYELLRGGIYEDFANDSTEVIDTVTTELPVNITSFDNDTQTIGESRDNPHYELFTTTETVAGEHLARVIDDTTANETSSEVFDEDNSEKSRLELDSSSESSDESSFEEISTENTSDNTILSTESTSTNNIKYDSLLSTSPPPTSTTLETEDDSTSTTADISTSNYFDAVKAQSTTEVPSSEMRESTETDLEITSTTEGYSSPSRRNEKKISHIKNKEDSEPSSTFNFPSIMSFQSLGTEEATSQTESDSVENTTTMARVGIYHPEKPNELAGYLTIVNDKLNVSSLNNSSIPPHILLTPHDLKKLAEMLIQEKIKPAFKDTGNSKNVESNLGERNVEQLKNSTIHNITIGGRQSTTEEDTIGTSDYTPTPNTENQSAKSILEQESQQARSSTSSPFDSAPEDPNTSRKIRIPQQEDEYSALLDDRDLLLLEDFFRKNMGIN